MNIAVWSTIQSGVYAIGVQILPVLGLAVGLALAHRLLPMGSRLLHSSILPRITARIPGFGSSSRQTRSVARVRKSTTEGGE